MKKQLTRNEAAEILGVSPQTISNYCKEGLIGSVQRNGRIICIDADELDEAKRDLKIIHAREKMIDLKKKALSEETISLNRKLCAIRSAMNAGRIEIKTDYVPTLISNIVRFVPGLKYRERDIIGKFVNGSDFQTLSEEYGVSVSRIMQILKKGISRFEDFDRIARSIRWSCESDYENEILKDQIKELKKEIEILRGPKTDSDISAADINYLTTLLSTKIECLNLSVRTYKGLALSKEKYETVGDILKRPKENLLNIKNIGRKSISEIVDVMDGLGLDFRRPYERDMDYYRRMMKLKNREA